MTEETQIKSCTRPGERLIKSISLVVGAHDDIRWYCKGCAHQKCKLDLDPRGTQCGSTQHRFSYDKFRAYFDIDCSDKEVDQKMCNLDHSGEMVYYDLDEWYEPYPCECTEYMQEKNEGLVLDYYNHTLSDFYQNRHK